MAAKKNLPKKTEKKKRMCSFSKPFDKKLVKVAKNNGYNVSEYIEAIISQAHEWD